MDGNLQLLRTQENIQSEKVLTSVFLESADHEIMVNHEHDEQ